jgi:hypothetical protein
MDVMKFNIHLGETMSHYHADPFNHYELYDHFANGVRAAVAMIKQ